MISQLTMIKIGQVEGTFWEGEITLFHTTDGERGLGAGWKERWDDKQRGRGKAFKWIYQKVQKGRELEHLYIRGFYHTWWNL